MSRNKVSDVIFFLLVFLMGFLSPVFVFLVVRSSISFTEISIQVDPLGIISIIVNVLLAIYITSVLNRKNEENRLEKNVLIDYLRDFQNSIDLTLREFLSAKQPIDFTDVVSRLKTFRQSFNVITVLMKKYEYNGDELCGVVDSCLRNINDSFTDTVTPDGGALISKDKISIGTNTRQEIESSILEIKKTIFDLIVRINRK